MRYGQASLFRYVFKPWRWGRGNGNLSGAGKGEQNAQTKSTNSSHGIYAFYKDSDRVHRANLSGRSRFRFQISRLPKLLWRCLAALRLLGLPTAGTGQSTRNSPPKLPGFQLIDATAASKIRFEHVASPEKRYLIESMSGGVLLLDYDQDGWLDIYFTNAPTVEGALRGEKARSALYHNNHDGTFTDVSKSSGVDDASGYYGLGVLWSDFNDDGRPDLFIADDSTPNYLYRNDGNGHFTDISYISGTAVSRDGGEIAGMGVAACDFNHSGRFSIYVTDFEDQSNTLYRNDDAMSFTEISYEAAIGAATIPYLGWGTGCVDFDNDGWPDLFVVNGHVYPQVDALAEGAKYRERKLVFLNQGDGTFRDVSNLVGSAVMRPEPSRGAAFGDLDNDGRIDVVVENIDGKPLILYNEGSSANHWITLQLTGTKSNRAAIGAKFNS